MADLLRDVSLWEVLGWTMIHFLWMGSIVLVIAAGLRRVVRKGSAKMRYAASLICLAALAGTALVAAAVAVRAVNDGIVEASVESTAGASQRSASRALAANPGRSSDNAITGRGVIEPLHDRSTPAAPQQEILGRLIPQLAGVLPWLWLCGTPLVALAFVTGLIGAGRLRRKTQIVAEPELLSRLERLQASLRITRCVALGVCEAVSSPLVIGVFRPLIVLPPALLTGLAPDQIEMILLHELAHVRRWDNLVNLMQRVLEAALYFHPAVWWVSRWVRLEREHCCDAVVLERDYTRQSYAETLAALALPELDPRYAAAAMANHQLTSRLCHILNVQETGMGISRRTILVSLAVVLIGTAVFTLLALPPQSVLAEHGGERPDEHPQAANDDSDREESLELLWSFSEDDDEMRLSDKGVIYYGDYDGRLMASIEEDAEGTPAWAPAQATGAPDVQEAGDSALAWASETADEREEWLRVTFAQPIKAAVVIVHETFNPGALRKVTTVDDRGVEVIVWEGEDPVSPDEGRGVAVLHVPVDMAISEITLHLDSPSVPGWNEIDAVGLIDAQTGKVHWAESAQASSSYAGAASEVSAYSSVLRITALDSPDETFLDFRKRDCRECHMMRDGRFLDNLTTRVLDCPIMRRQRIEELEAELDRLKSAPLGGVQPADDGEEASESRESDDEAGSEDASATPGGGGDEALSGPAGPLRGPLAPDGPTPGPGGPGILSAEVMGMGGLEWDVDLQWESEIEPGDLDDAAETLRELRRSLRRQQQVIDRLTVLLESRSNESPDEEAAEEPKASNPSEELR